MNLRMFQTGKGLLALIAVVGTCLSLLMAVPTYSSQSNANLDENEYNRDRSALAATAVSGNLSVFKKQADSLQAKWESRNKNYYYLMTALACSELSSHDFRNTSQYDLKAHYAEEALKEGARVPLALAVGLAEQMTLSQRSPGQYRSNQTERQQWLEERSVRAGLWLQVWQRLNDATIGGFNFADLPFENVPLPRGIVGTSGMPPEAITDPKARELYRAALARNQTKSKTYNEQYEILNLKQSYLSSLEKHLVVAYAGTPDDIGELTNLLDKHHFPVELKAQIIDSTRRVRPSVQAR